MIDSKHKEIIDKLKLGQRAKLKAEPELLKACLNELYAPTESLSKVFCLLCHWQTPSREIAQALEQLDPKNLRSEDQIYFLQALDLHNFTLLVQNKGDLSLKLQQSLRKLLKSKDPEVLLWSLSKLLEQRSFLGHFRQEIY